MTFSSRVLYEPVVGNSSLRFGKFQLSQKQLNPTLQKGVRMDRI